MTPSTSGQPSNVCIHAYAVRRARSSKTTALLSNRDQPIVLTEAQVYMYRLGPALWAHMYYRGYWATCMLQVTVNESSNVLRLCITGRSMISSLGTSGASLLSSCNKSFCCLGEGTNEGTNLQLFTGAISESVLYICHSIDQLNPDFVWHLYQEHPLM